MHSLLLYWSEYWISKSTESLVYLELKSLFPQTTFSIPRIPIISPVFFIFLSWIFSIQIATWNPEDARRRTLKRTREKSDFPIWVVGSKRNDHIYLTGSATVRNNQQAKLNTLL
jgi:hypothetical protein